MYLNVGKVTSFHGVKSELKVRSNNKDIFKKDKFIYVGESKVKEKVINTRLHKDFVLILLEGYKNVDEVYKYRNDNVYIKKSEYEDTFILEEVIGYTLYEDTIKRGLITNIRVINDKNTLLEVKYNEKVILVPKDLIINIDKLNKSIIISTLKGLFDEN